MINRSAGANAFRPVPLVLALFAVGLLLMGANGCSSNPYVEGAKLDMRNKDFDRALESLNRALEQEPQNAQAYKLRGDIYHTKAFEAGVPVDSYAVYINKMMAAYDNAVEYDPELSDEVQEAKRMAYIKTMTAGGEKFKQAQERRQEGEEGETALAKAATYFENASVIQPDSAASYENQGYVLLSLGRSADAIEPLEASIETGVERPQPYIYLSQLYAQEDRLEDAVALLEEATQVFPDSDEVQAQLLNAYVQAGMTDQALAQYEQAVEQYPDSALYRLNYGTLLLKMDRHDQAIEQLRRATELDPESIDAFYNLGVAYANQAVVANDRIGVLADSLRNEEANLSAVERDEINQQLEQLAQERETFFRDAIPPLERAREISQQQGTETQAVCQALFQAYVQTGQEEKAEQISACAGYEE